ncbi:fibro-slime domain-containing protein [Exilibacterium tricleocarpae]|uniref:Fibro-slime domain-containing protein n=1 Tax=Exilibacterium tricleocarpae TaxID=2591008 RepID=A0A545TAH5_9GAMM|nr:PKD domain-containing protein [Exilibacterium tricleocarpae]TQV74216.1 fibro-slime domain-containing protein [Exilibacterium tricleocarpae]
MNASPVKALPMKTRTLLACVLIPLALWGCSGESSPDAGDDGDKSALKNETPFAFVQRSITDTAQKTQTLFDAKFSDAGQTPLELMSPYDFNPGAKLLVRSGLDPEAVNEDILSTYFGTGVYDVKDLNVSPDGKQLVFAARGAESHPTDSTWNIFLYNFESKRLRRVIEDDAFANAGQDTNPTITWDGDIIFSSDRDAGNPARPRENIELVGTLCRKIDPVENPSLLHSMSIDGENLIQLTYGRYNHDIKPGTLKDGRVAFVRWERSFQPVTNCPAGAKGGSGDIFGPPETYPNGLGSPDRWDSNTTCRLSKSTPTGLVAVTNHYKLLTIGEDKESLEQLYNTVTAVSSEEAFLAIDRIFQAENGNLFSLVRHQYNPVSGGALLELQPTHNASQGTVFTQLSARALTSKEVDLYPGQLSDNGWFSAFWPYRDGTSRLMISWANCTLQDGGVSSFCNAQNTDGELDVKYGLWVFDPASDTRSPLVQAKQDTVFSDLAMAQPHTGDDLSLTPFDPNFVDNEDATRIKCSFDNNAPLALAGPDRSGLLGQSFTFDGSNSSDPDGDPITYYWSLTAQPDNSTVALSNANVANPSLLPDQVGVYTLQLVVNDGELDSAPDSVTLTVVQANNGKPVANAGPDQRVLLGATVALNGSASSDPDGDPLTYRWSVISRPAGSSAALNDAAAAMPQFTPDRQGVYIVELIVNDGVYDSAADTVNITVGVAPNNSKPIANAGPDVAGLVGTPVALNGSGSRDPDGDSLSYRWTLISAPAGANAMLNNAGAVTPSLTSDQAGSYIVQLIVNDGRLDSDADTATVTLNPANSAPIANAGANRQVRINELVMLDGTGSRDPDGDALTYRWALVSQPGGGTLANANSAQPSFTPTQPGVYTARLIVNDGSLDSAPDTVAITVTDPNTKPVANAGVDQTVNVGDRVSLDGSRSSDADGDPLTYRWVLASQPNGSSVMLTDADKVNPSFTAGEEGIYTVQLVVNDGTDDSEMDSVSITVNQLQNRPVANAGPDQTGPLGDVFVLDGSASRDADGDPLTYAWTLLTQPDDSQAVLSDPTAVNPQLEADVAGAYTVQLIVNDGQVNSAPDTVTLTAEAPNNKPVANAGPDQHFEIDQTLVLDGSGSTDPDGDALTYAWEIVSPANPTASLSDTTAVAPSIKLTGPETYVVQLVVYDGKAFSEPDTVTLNHSNTKPVANAGPDQKGNVGEEIVLDGSGSTDVDGDPLTYRWSLLSQPITSQAALDDTTAVKPRFTLDAAGMYEVQLIVNDGYVDSNPDIVLVHAAENTAPVASAGPDQIVNNGSVANLDGSGSFDADNDPLTYRWSLLRKPASSQSQLSDTSSVTPTLDIDVYGEYVAQLIVNDGSVDSAPDTVRLTSENLRPVAKAGDDRGVDVGRKVTLDGSDSYDPDGSNLSYRWSLIRKPQGSTADLQNAESAQPDFTADREGTYVAQLIVNDGLLDSRPDTVAITATEEPTTCEISHETKRTLPITIRDFKRSHPDFEYRIGEDYGIVKSTLGSDGLPVYSKRNGSTPTTTGRRNFDQWYRDVPGVNINIPKTLTISRQPDSTVWSYSNDDFFPIDGEGWGNTGLTTPDHNYHFTLETHLVFDYKGGEVFTFVGDDDLWLFINGKRVIDIGGVHSALTRTVRIDQVANSLGLEKGKRYSFDLFFAERHTTKSEFAFQTNMDLECVPTDEQ